MRTIRRNGGYLAVAATIAALTACSSSGGGTGASTRPAGGPNTSPAPQTTSASTPTVVGRKASTVAHSSLSGKWSGHYSGAFSGTFTLTWHESGENLSGSIRISSMQNEPAGINGTVQGDHIRFGTVGSQAIQYAGNVSGGTMSGTWQIGAVNGKAAGRGSWSAAKA